MPWRKWVVAGLLAAGGALTTMVTAMSFESWAVSMIAAAGIGTVVTLLVICNLIDQG